MLEYAESGSLQQLLKRFGHLEEPLIARYLRSTLVALAYLHAHDVIHRDIKAANILMTKTGDVKVADFGIASTLSEAASSQTPGSPFWLAPEVIEMDPVSSAADIWALGCTVIELLTGTPPYFELNTIQAMYAIVQDRHPPMPKLPISPELTDFLELCFQAKPEDRPSAAALLSHRFLALHLSESVPDYYRDPATAGPTITTAPPTAGALPPSSSYTPGISPSPLPLPSPASKKQQLGRTDTVQSVQRLLKESALDAELSKVLEMKLAELVEMKKRESGFRQALDVARTRLMRAEEQYSRLQDQLSTSRDELRQLCTQLSFQSGIDGDAIWAEKERELASVPNASVQRTEEFVLSIIGRSGSPDRHSSSISRGSSPVDATRRSSNASSSPKAADHDRDPAIAARAHSEYATPPGLQIRLDERQALAKSKKKSAHRRARSVAEVGHNDLVEHLSAAASVIAHSTPVSPAPPPPSARSKVPSSSLPSPATPSASITPHNSLKSSYTPSSGSSSSSSSTTTSIIASTTTTTISDDSNGGVKKGHARRKKTKLFK